MEEIIIDFYLDVINASNKFRSYIKGLSITVMDVWSREGVVCLPPDEFRLETQRLIDAVAEEYLDGTVCSYCHPYSYALLNLLNKALLDDDLNGAKEILKKCFND